MPWCECSALIITSNHFYHLLNLQVIVITQNSILFEYRYNVWCHNRGPIVSNTCIVKPVYKGHSKKPENVEFVSSCPLYTC